MSVAPMVPNAPIRRAFEDSGMTLAEVADRVYPGSKATTRVGRLLGIYEERGKVLSEIKAEKARQLLAAMHLDPVDVGL